MIIQGYMSLGLFLVVVVDSVGYIEPRRRPLISVFHFPLYLLSNNTGNLRESPKPCWHSLQPSQADTQMCLCAHLPMCKLGNIKTSFGSLGCPACALESQYSCQSL